MVDVVRWRVIAERDQLDPLQAHHPVALGPAPVVADHHADHAAERTPDRKAQVAYLEVALFEVLERDALAMIGVAGQMDLAILADDLAVRADQDRGVVAVSRAALLRDLGVAEMEADLELGGELEQRPGRRVGHLLLEPAVDLGDLVVPVTREEGSERELRIDHELTARGVRLAHQLHQPADHARPVVGEMDWPELRRADPELPCHVLLSPSRRSCSLALVFGSGC